VALKIFSPQVGQNAGAMKAVERIYAETNALGQDVVAPILDAGFDPQTACPFSAVPLLPTPSLQAIVQRTPMGLPDVSGLLAGMARTLDGAHIRHLFHHALKPTNVFLTPNPGGAPRDVRLTDFGVGTARAVVQTQEGYTLAAPWLAPEQLQPNVQSGAAADVFTSALVAFYALTGTSFWRSCQNAQPDLQAWQSELFGGRNVASLRASEVRVPLHSGLDPIFAKALATDPNQRYRTVGELAAAFDQVANARAPEAATTMAFPAISDMDMNAPMGGGMGGMGMGGGMSPAAGAPAPAAGAYAAPPPQGGGAYPPAPSPMGMQPPQGAGPSPYVAAQDLGGAPAPPAAAQAKKGNAVMFVVIGVVGLGALSLIFFLWRSHAASKAAEAAAKSAGPIAVDAPSSKPIALPPPPPPPATTSEAGSPPSATPTASATGSADAPAATVELKVTCKPDCDEIKVDDVAVDAKKPLALAPGERSITFSKAGYKPVTEKVKVEAGKPLPLKTVTLVQDAVAVAPTAPPPGTGTGSKPPPPPGTGTGSKPPGTGTGGSKPPPCKKTKFTKCP
jgi:eukaryotic-like serine/threonine-protein kinase